MIRNCCLVHQSSDHTMLIVNDYDQMLNDIKKDVIMLQIVFDFFILLLSGLVQSRQNSNHSLVDLLADIIKNWAGQEFQVFLDKLKLY